MTTAPGAAPGEAKQRQRNKETVSVYLLLRVSGKGETLVPRRFVAT
jgi:hypothetical protein